MKYPLFQEKAASRRRRQHESGLHVGQALFGASSSFCDGGQAAKMQTRPCRLLMAR
jgi:hypothetical protein